MRTLQGTLNALQNNKNLDSWIVLVLIAVVLAFEDPNVPILLDLFA